MTRHCARCGVVGEAPEGGMPEGWSLDVGESRPTGRGSRSQRVTYLCRTCTRANVRSIEAKLPQEWWE